MTLRRRGVERGVTVHLWVFPENTPADASLLSAEERAAAARRIAAAHRDEYVRAHACLRRVLGAALVRDPCDVAFERDPNGKPRLACGRIEFNLSHASGACAVAVAAAPVGVDIEAKDRQIDYDLLSREILSPRELTAWRAAAPDRRRRMMLEMWVRKEAALKATGEGLAGDMRRIDGLDATAGAPPYAQLAHTERHICAVASTTPIERVIRRR